MLNYKDHDQLANEDVQECHLKLNTEAKIINAFVYAIYRQKLQDKMLLKI